MRWVLLGDRQPGQPINVLELSRQFAVSPSAVREFLSRLRAYGLVERRQSGAWILSGFTPAFAEELCEVRALFELRSALRFIALPEDDPAWLTLQGIRDEHVALLADGDARYADFPELDERLHRCIHDVARNRFIEGFHEAIAMVFHYHYQWNKRDERQRNVAAIHEHLRYIDALLARDAAAVTETCHAHLATARLTLLAALRRPARGAAAGVRREFAAAPSGAAG